MHRTARLPAGERVAVRSIAVIGVGRIGVVTAVGLAHLEHRVVGIDLSGQRVAALNGDGELEREPGLRAALRSARRYRRIEFRVEAPATLADVAFVCVDTPQADSGGVDLSQALAASETAARLVRRNGILVTRCTAPVGTGDRIAARLAGLGRQDVAVVHVPEFLREGHAWEDFRAPDRIVIGGDGHAVDEVAALFAPLRRPVVRCDRRTAELAKYAANAYLATSISFANELSDLAASLSADAGTIFEVLRADHRIGPSAYLTPGLGFGGHCLPKDTAGLLNVARRHGVSMRQLAATRAVNEGRIAGCVAWLDERLGGLRARRIAILGLAFKPGTDDLRESPSVALANRLARHGAHPVAWDPLVRPADAPITLHPQLATALRGADAAVLAHPRQSGELTPATAADLMRGRFVFDAPGVLDAPSWRAAGFRLNRPHAGPPRRSVAHAHPHRD